VNDGLSAASERGAKGIRALAHLASSNLAIDAKK